MNYLYIGRFQPFHLGHLDAVQQAFSRGASHIIIGLGTPQLINTENPWTITQRENMITGALKEAGINPQTRHTEIIPDFDDDQQWYEYIIDELPSFETVMSGNPWVQDIFDACPYEVFDPEVQSKIDIHGTQIRKWLNVKNKLKTKEYLSTYVYNTLALQN